MKLSEAISRIIQEFGKDVIAEKRFVYMIADYYSFRDNPAEKHVLNAIVNNGFALRLMNLSEDLDASIISNKIIEDVCKNYGFQEELVEDVVVCIMRGIGIKFRYPPQNDIQSFGKVNHNPIKVTKSQTCHKKDISLYSGEDLMIILKDIFMLPLRSGRDGAVQKAMIKQLLGDEDGQFVLDCFLDKEVIKWSPGLKAFYTTYGNAKEFARLHDKKFH